MRYRTALRIRLIHTSILPSFSPSCKPLGPFGSLEAEWRYSFLMTMVVYHSPRSLHLDSEDLGKRFDRSNLHHMRNFYHTYPMIDASRRQLSWTHYRLLLKVEKPEARAFYEQEAIQSRWSAKELERQINSLLFERLALSRDKVGALALAQKGYEIARSTIEASFPSRHQRETSV